MMEGHEMHEFSPHELFSDIVLYTRKSVVAPTRNEDESLKEIVRQKTLGCIKRFSNTGYMNELAVE